jgi:hypothetical protein
MITNPYIFANIASDAWLSSWLVRYWNMDDSWWVKDLVGWAVATVNWATFTTWKIRGWYAWNWTSQWIDSAAPIPNKAAWTFNMWVRDTRATDVLNTAIVADSWWGFFVARSHHVSTPWKFRFDFFSWSAKVISETVAHNKNQWYMITLCWNSVNIELFKDAVSQWTVPAWALGSNANNLDFFTNATSTWFEWDLDETWSWNRNLSQTELDKLLALWSGYPYNF